MDKIRNLKRATLTIIRNLERGIVLLLVFFILLYKKTLSPFLSSLGGGCRFAPSCASYTCEVLKKFGLFKGSYLALKRILRCSSLSKGGVDPVPKNI